MTDNPKQIEAMREIILGEIYEVYKRLTALKAELETATAELCTEIRSSSEFSINSLRNYGAQIQTQLEKSSEIHSILSKNIGEMNTLVETYTKTRMEEHLAEARRTLQVDIVEYTIRAIEKGIEHRMLPVMNKSVKNANTATTELANTAKATRKSLMLTKLPKPLLITGFLVVFIFGLLSATWVQQRFWGTLSAQELTWIENGKFLERIWPELDEETKQEYMELYENGEGK